MVATPTFESASKRFRSCTNRSHYWSVSKHRQHDLKDKKVYKVVIALYGLHQAPRACLGADELSLVKRDISDEFYGRTHIFSVDYSQKEQEGIFFYISGQDNMDIAVCDKAGEVILMWRNSQPILSTIPGCQIVTDVDGLEKDLKQTKWTMGSVKEEPEDQGRKSQDDSLVSLVQGEQLKLSPGCISKAKVHRLREGDIEKKETREEAQRIAEEEELNEQQKERRAQVQFEAQHYTDEDWDLIRAKIEANAELSKSVLGSDLQGEDFAKKMVDLVNQRKKHFAEERARAKRNKPMTQSQLKKYLMKILKESREMELSQWQGEGLHTDLIRMIVTDSDEASEQDDCFRYNLPLIILVPVGYENHLVSLLIRYQAGRERYGMNGLEDELEKVLWEYLKNMFEEPLSTDPIWSLLGQQRIISWRYYDTCRVHYLNLESMDIYMLIERQYPLSAEVCKAMLDKKLQGGKPDEDCYKMLKMMEKQAGIRK
ncbi:hypothetical protein Tco_0494013 [Tanacetum coccineum]